MRSTLCSCALLLALAAPAAVAQSPYYTATGVPPYSHLVQLPLGSYNEETGNLVLKIPLASFVQHSGRAFQYALVYNSTFWQPTGGFPSEWYPENGAGWSLQEGLDDWGGLDYSTVVYKCQNGSGTLQGTYTNYSNWVYIDASGTAHTFSLTPSSYTRTSGCETTTGIPDNTAYPPIATDSGVSDDGFYIAIANATEGVVYAPDGTQVYPSWEDTNGNESTVKYDSGGNPYWFDDTGRHLPVINLESGQPKMQNPTSPPSPTTFTLDGGQYTVTYELISICTQFNETGGVLEYCPASSDPNAPYKSQIAVPESLKLPDGGMYTFGYDSGSTPGHYGELTSVTLPQGGTITYHYGLFSRNTAVIDNQEVLESVTAGSDVWTIAPTMSPSYQVTITGPSRSLPSGGSVRDDTVYTVSADGTAKTTTRYSGAVTSGTVLSSTVESDESLGGLVRPHQVKTTLPDGSTSTKQYDYTNPVYPSPFSGVYNLQAVSTWDYGNAGSTPNRKTTYAYITSPDYVTSDHMTNLLCEVSTYSNGLLLSDKRYGYDGGNAGCSSTATTAPATTSGSVGNSVLGSPTHDDANFGSGRLVRGNRTSTSEMVSPSHYQITNTSDYNILGDRIGSIDGSGNETTFDYSDSWKDSSCATSSSFAYPTRITQQPYQNLVTLISYNSCDGTASVIKNPNDVATSGPGTVLVYDSSQRLWTMSGPDGGATTYTYTPTSVTTTVTASPDPSRTSSLEVDGFNRITNEVFADGARAAVTAAVTYDGNNLPATIENPHFDNGSYGTTYRYYDALGREVFEKEQDGTTRQWAYNGRTEDVYDEEGKHSRRLLDAFGDLVKVFEPDSSNNPTLETDYSYDGNSNLIRVDQWGGPNGASGELVRTFGYDGLSELICAANPENSSGTCPATAASSPPSTVMTYSYEPSGRLATRRDARGIVTQFSYDLVGRLSSKGYNDGVTPTVYYGYDGKDYSGSPIQGVTNSQGRLSYASAGASTSTYSYDSMGRVVSKSACIPTDCTGDIVVGAAYDQAADLHSLSNGSRSHPITWTYSYNNAGQLATISSSVSADSITKLFDATSASPASYGPDGLEYARLGYNTGTNQPLLTYQRASDVRMRPIFGSYYDASGASLYSYCMPGTGNQHCNASGAAYTGDGNVADVVDSVTGTWKYSYDNLNRLQKGTATAGPYSGKIGCWYYDAFGNRTGESVSSTDCNADPPLTNWAIYGESNNQMSETSQLSAQGAFYDAAGNITFDGMNNYLYDAEGRVCAVENSLTLAATGYAFDPEGNRVAKGSLTTFSCDMAKNGFVPTVGYVVTFRGEQMTEITGSRAWAHSNLFVGGQLFATYKGSDVYFSLNDWLGTRRAEVGGSGCGKTTYSNLPFGTSLVTSGGCPYVTEQHYTGKERDAESGNDCFGARYYGSSMGRFLSPDPLGPWVADATNPQSWNMYAYAMNNPLINVDPTGLDCVYFNDAGDGIESVDRNSNSGECGQNGGDWINGTLRGAMYFGDSDTWGFRSGDASNSYLTYANAPGSESSGISCSGNCDLANGYFQSSNMQTNDVALNPFAQAVFRQVGLQTGPTYVMASRAYCNAVTFGNAGAITGAVAGAPIPKSLITSVPSAGGPGVSSITSLSSAASSSVFSGGDPVLTGGAGQFLKSISATENSFAGTARIGGALGRVGGKVAGSEAAVIVSGLQATCYGGTP